MATTKPNINQNVMKAIGSLRTVVRFRRTREKIMNFLKSLGDEKELFYSNLNALSSEEIVSLLVEFGTQNLQDAKDAARNYGLLTTGEIDTSQFMNILIRLDNDDCAGDNVNIIEDWINSLPKKSCTFFKMRITNTEKEIAIKFLISMINLATDEQRNAKANARGFLPTD